MIKPHYLLLFVALLLGNPGQAAAGQRGALVKSKAPASSVYKSRATRPGQVHRRPGPATTGRSTSTRGPGKPGSTTLKITRPAPLRKVTDPASGPSKPTRQALAKAAPGNKPAPAKLTGKRNTLFKHREKIRGFQKEFAGERQEILASQGADHHVADVMRHSERNGQYHIVSDLHWGQGRLGANKDGPWDPREDFRRGESFARFVGQIAKSKRGVSLVIGGDWLELMEHADASASIADVKKDITRIVEGHAVESRAIAKAVTQKGMRLIYLAGNHDVHLVDSRVRDHLVAEIARVGGVKPSQRSQFATRVAYSGHGAVLGRYGEAMVVHGHAQDAANSWRSVVNPYNARHELQSNLGWNIVGRLYRSVEKLDPMIDNTGKSSTKAVAKKIFTSPRHIATAIKIVWDLLGGVKHFGKAGNLSERLDDRVTMRAWEQRTGFAEKMNTALPGAAPGSKVSYAKTIEGIYQRAPGPLHERMKTSSRLVNFLAAIATAWSSARKVKQSEPALLGSMTGELPNVRYVVWGHNHKEAVVEGNSRKGPLAHYNAGTWTKVEGEWRLNVVSGHTSSDGRLTMDGVFRTELASGKPILPNKYDKSEARPVPGWNNEARPALP